MEYDKDKRELKVDRLLSNLDKFVIEFLRVLEKYVDYTLISGYISIVLGRSRSTEDVDILIKKGDKNVFEKLFDSLDKEGFWCINAASLETAWDYLISGHSIRFARKNQSMPNFEVKFPKKIGEFESFRDTIRINLPSFSIKACSLESHIAFKKYFLKSDKDIEDAVHVEELFKKDLDYDKINKYKQIIEDDERN